MKNKDLNPRKVLHVVEWIFTVIGLLFVLMLFEEKQIAAGLIVLLSAFIVSPLFERTRVLRDNVATRAASQFIISFFLFYISTLLSRLDGWVQAIVVTVIISLSGLFFNFLSVKSLKDTDNDDFGWKIGECNKKLEIAENNINSIEKSKNNVLVDDITKKEISELKSKVEFLEIRINELNYRMNNSNLLTPVVTTQKELPTQTVVTEDKFKQYLDEYKEDNYTKDNGEYTANDLTDRLMDIIDNLTKKKSTKDAGIAFENIVCKIIKSNGFTNIDTTPVSNDDGVDVTADKDSVSYAIQCKCYSNTVGKEAVQEVYTGKSVYQKDKAIVITNNYFSKHAIETAGKLDVKLWDRDNLINMIKISDMKVISDLIAEHSGIRITVTENLTEKTHKIVENQNKESVPPEYKAALDEVNYLRKNFYYSNQKIYEKLVNEEGFNSESAKYAIEQYQDYMSDFDSLSLEYKSALHAAKLRIGEWHYSPNKALKEIQEKENFAYETALFAINNLDKYYADIK